jgi:hypothetical protein
MPTIAAHGLSAELPRGWDGQIFVREIPPALRDDPALTSATSVAWPILHAANFALPTGRGDYGGNAVEAMGSGGIFVALLESDPVEADSPMFRHPVPWPVVADDLQTNQMQRGVPGGAGYQRFFTTGGRAMCLYVAIGSHSTRAVLVREVNRLLATVRIDPR